MEGRLSLRQQVRQTLDLEQQLGLQWDKRLKEENFAPSALGKVNDKQYEEQNLYYAEFSAQYLLQNSVGNVIAAGRGHGDEESIWLPKILAAGRRPMVVDVSQLACAGAEENIRRILPQIGNTAYEVGEIVINRGFGGFLLEDLDSLLEPPLTIFFSRFLSSQKRDLLRRILQATGLYLSDDLDPRKLNRVVLIHPFAEDNKDIVWTRTYPYSRRLIMGNLQKGARRELIAENQAQIKYFGYKKITAMVIRAL